MPSRKYVKMEFLSSKDRENLKNNQRKEKSEFSKKTME